MRKINYFVIFSILLLLFFNCEALLFEPPGLDRDGAEAYLEEHGDQYEPNDSFDQAYEIEAYDTSWSWDNPNTIYPTIHSDSDVDWFKVWFNLGETYYIDMNFYSYDSDDSECNYDLELYNSSQGFEKGSYNEGWENYEWINFNCLASGFYYIKVYSQYGHNASDTYELGVTYN